MKTVYSYIKERGKNRKIEIDSILNQGLPKVSFSGFHEASARESLVRVKSAIQNQDFEWSLEKHLILSAKGVEKTKSTWCDLSVAASILLKTEQLKFTTKLDVVFVGELSLNGEIMPCSLSENGFVPTKNEIWIGNFLESRRGVLNIKNLNDLNSLQAYSQKVDEVNLKPSPYTNQVEMLSPAWSELFEVIVHGEHSLLFLTPQNPALIEFFKLIQKNLKKLTDDELSEVAMTAQGLRPLVVINPSVTKWQILGQSAEEKKGLYHYANGGLVCMDLFFTLNKGVREAVSSLTRGGALMGDKKLKSLLFARSPLCPCGKAKVGVPRKCSFSLYKCRSMIERISLDELSMFQIVVAFNGPWQEMYPHPDLDMTVLNQKKELACEMQKQRGQVVPNSRLGLHELTEMMSKDCKVSSYLPMIEGLERTVAILSVARTLADLEGALEIEADHVERSKAYVFSVPKEVMSTF
jgi:hypothetical protein